MRSLLLAALLLHPAVLRAATGGDYAGADLTPVNGEILSGTFLNVRLFSLPAGATVYTAPGAILTVYASTISLQGTLDASGRGQNGGSGGPINAAGSVGFGGGPSGAGAGSLGAAQKGGGGGAHGGGGGIGAGVGGGAGGSSYGSTGTAASFPLSADDLFLGSGGGGGGGGTSGLGGPGGSGGGAVYLEASSVTVTGAILLNGSTAAAVLTAGNNPGAGGGGSGGSILLRVTGDLLMANALLSARGGNGGNVADSSSGTLDPGGGGGGGRIKIFGRTSSFSSVTFSTGAGSAGGKGGFLGTIDPAGLPTAGSVGTVSFGAIASSPTAFAAQNVYVTSIAWSWAATPSFGDAPAASHAYRIFPATTTAPLVSPETTAAAAATGVTITNLTPNTTYARFVTAFSEWGDSERSLSISTHTLASVPQAGSPAFSAVGSAGLTASWTAGSPDNPSYTLYELQTARDASFSTGLMTSFATSLSSSPAGLSPNASYFLRARAVNIEGVASDFTATMTTATLAQTPGSASVSGVHVTSAVFTWSSGGNPSDTVYEAAVSSDNFFSVNGTSATLASSATFFGLTPGSQYYFRVRALNRLGAVSDYTPSVSAYLGNLADVSPPSAPGTPASDRPYSYDGNVLFIWSAASSAVGILDYDLLVGSTPGGNDIFAGRVQASSYTATNLATGRSYFAQVSARSNAGVSGPFSAVSQGVPVFSVAQTAPISKPFAWPNPFDPASGPVQIGFSLNAPADVLLRIYTLQGRLIREISTRYTAAGNQIASWNGADSSGARAAPGGYIVLIQKRYDGRVDSQRVKVALLY